MNNIVLCVWNHIMRIFLLLQITVSKIFKVVGPPGGVAGHEAQEPLSPSHLVELSVLAPSGIDAVADDMKNFAEQLKPLVILDKIDPKRASM